MSEWQTIESAPRDGTPVLVAERGPNGWWIDVGENMYDISDGPDKWRGRESSNVTCEPTHWMPLPEPPK